MSELRRRPPVPDWLVSLQVVAGAKLVNRAMSPKAYPAAAVVAASLAPPIRKRRGILVWAAEPSQPVAVD